MTHGQKFFILQLEEADRNSGRSQIIEQQVMLRESRRTGNYFTPHTFQVGNENIQERCSLILFPIAGYMIPMYEYGKLEEMTLSK